MDNILNKSLSNSQEKELIANTLERVSEINTLVDRETIPPGFEVDEEGVWSIQEKNNAPPSREWLCAPLWVTAYIRDHKNENHGRILEFQDIDGHKHQWIMPMDLLAGEGTKILKALYNMGLRISPKRRMEEKLLEYIAQCNPVRRARCVFQCGWFNSAFVLPSQVIGYAQKEKILYDCSTNSGPHNDTAGSLDEWKDKIAAKAIGNSRLIFSISGGFTGPLLQLLNYENIGLHYRGPSSLGKSTAGYVANSIWGPQENVRTFRATANGLEGIASLHNDRLLCLDELGQIDPKEAGQVIYMLGNGMGKERATQHGTSKKRTTWRLLFISTGELSLAQLLGEIGKKVKAGQEVRFIEIPADTGVHGLFENLHGFEGGADFAMYLKNSCLEFYGTASKAFLERLVEDIEGSVDLVKTIVNGIRQRYLPQNASSQVIRVFNHFALIAAAGELASEFGVTGWKVETAISGVMECCFTAWLGSRGNLGMHEEKEALAQVRTFFAAHEESRFTPWDKGPDDKSRTNNRMGFRKETDAGTEFYVFSEQFRNEICQGMDYRYVEQVCLKHGYLLSSPDGAPTRVERLPGMKKNMRCYRFNPEILSE